MLKTKLKTVSLTGILVSHRIKYRTVICVCVIMWNSLKVYFVWRDDDIERREWGSGAQWIRVTCTIWDARNWIWALQQASHLPSCWISVEFFLQNLFHVCLSNLISYHNHSDIVLCSHMGLLCNFFQFVNLINSMDMPTIKTKSNYLSS